MPNQLANWEKLFEEKITTVATLDDPAHDLLHFKRVVKTAKQLAEQEDALLEVVIPAAWLHDLVIVPKNDPRRSEASRLSGEEAIKFLTQIDYPAKYYSAIAHAIETHSFSANVTPETIEAKVVQDADRLDGIGAIGVARCFVTAGLLKTQLYSEQDPFCKTRAPNDKQFTVDHFYRKLFVVAESLKTKAGQTEGLRRLEVMKNFLGELSQEL